MKFWRRIILMISFCAALGSANENLTPDPERGEIFVISYKFSMKNEHPIGEKYSISVPMTQKSTKISYSCEIDARADDFDDDTLSTIDALKLLLHARKDDVILCLQKAGAEVKSHEFRKNAMARTDVRFAVGPSRVKARVENGFLMLDVLDPKNGAQNENRYR